MPNPTRKTIENARLLFRNFSGREGQYNREGDRNFAVLLDDPKMVKTLRTEGWNVKELKAREEGEEPQPYLPVAVNFNGKQPPKIVMISERLGSTIRTDISEDNVDVLDWVEIAKADLVLNPYEWAVSGKSGVKAYLKSIYITLDQDELDAKYSDVPYANELDSIPEEDEA